MSLVLILWRYSRSMLGFAIFGGILAGASGAALLALINNFLQGQKLPWMVAAFAVLLFLVPMTSTLATYLLLRLGQQAIVDMRMDLVRKILGTPLRKIEEVGQHRLYATLTQDIGSITQAVAMIPLVCMNGAVVVGCLVYLGTMSWKVFLVVLGMMVLGLGAYQLPLLLGGRRLQMFRQSSDTLFGHLKSLTGGVKELKLHHGRRKSYLGRVQENSDELRDLGVSAITIFTIAASVGQFLAFLVIAGVLFGAPLLGESRPEVLSSYVLVLLYLLGPLEAIMEGIPQVGRANVALQKIEELGLSLHEGDALAKSAGNLLPAASGATFEAVELRGVQHTYHRDDGEREFTLGPIDLSLKPGEVVFLVGGNGSGKTTLAKMLVGLYWPDEGTIWLDGKEVDEEGMATYLQKFSVVFADFHLFDELLGLQQADLDERAKEFLTLLELDHKVEVEEGKFSTTELSQGQRKRLALLTAYVEDRPIYVFDEWAADQDPHFKEVFYRRLLPALKERGKTVCVISHDDHYYDAADRLVKLEDGKLGMESVPKLVEA